MQKYFLPLQPAIIGLLALLSPEPARSQTAQSAVAQECVFELTMKNAWEFNSVLWWTNVPQIVTLNVRLNTLAYTNPVRAASWKLEVPPGLTFTGMAPSEPYFRHAMTGLTNDFFAGYQIAPGVFEVTNNLRRITGNPAPAQTNEILAKFNFALSPNLAEGVKTFRVYDTHVYEDYEGAVKKELPSHGMARSLVLVHNSAQLGRTPKVIVDMSKDSAGRPIADISLAGGYAAFALVSSTNLQNWFVEQYAVRPGWSSAYEGLEFTDPLVSSTPAKFYSGIPATDATNLPPAQARP